jgi:hypothetical protein
VIEVKSNASEPDFIIAMDGNFQQRHYAYSSKDTPSEDQYPPSFIQPSQIVLDVQSIQATEAAARGIDVCCIYWKFENDIDLVRN